MQTTIWNFSCFAAVGPIPQTVFVLFGPLPAGTYTYEVYTKYENFDPVLFTTQSIVAAAPPPIPAFDTVGLLLLTASLGALGLVSLGRR